MAAALDVALPYVRERRQFGQPIGTFELVQGKLADMYAALNACRSYAYTVAAACDRADATRKDAAACILFCAEAATRAALDAIQLLGRQRLHQRLSDRTAAARRQALRDRRRHLGNPPHADRPGAVRGSRVSDLFEPLDDHPAYRQIANVIEQRIVERSLRTGDALPSETDLARQFGVNRSTVREAIRELETQGLLGRGRGEKRLRVTRPAPHDVSSGVSRALALHDVTFLELWEAMMAIEPAAAQYAAARRTEAHLRELMRTSARFQRASGRYRGGGVRGGRVLHRGRRRERQPGARPVAGAAQCAARAHAHPDHRPGAAGPRAHREAQARITSAIKLAAQRSRAHLDGKAHPRLQARLELAFPPRRPIAPDAPQARYRICSRRVSPPLGSCTRVLNETSTRIRLPGIAEGMRHAGRYGESPDLAGRHLHVANPVRLLEAHQTGSDDAWSFPWPSGGT